MSSSKTKSKRREKELMMIETSERRLDDIDEEKLRSDKDYVR